MARAVRLQHFSDAGYYIRLYARLADDLVAGRTPDPNPFALPRSEYA